MARRLAQGSQQSQRRRGPGKPFPKGVCQNPGGIKKEQRAAADSLRELATAHGSAPDPNDPEGRPRALVALAELLALGLGGNVPALTAYLDRVGLKPIDRAEVSGDGFVFSIRKRIAPDAADCPAG